MSLIHGLEVEFDDVAVGVEDEDLRVARDRWWTHHLPNVAVGSIVAETLVAEPRQRIAIALHAQCKMNIVGIVRLVTAERRVRADYDVELLLSVADLVPDSRIVEGGAIDFLHFQDASVELSRAFHVVGSNVNMMEVGFVHGRQVTAFYAPCAC